MYARAWGHIRAAVVLCLVLASAATLASQPGEKTSILFVGNSILYYQDVPQMLVALARSQDASREVEVEMLAQGGFSLADHVATGTLLPLIESGRFDYLVLQDVGGWPYCGADNERCSDSEPTLEMLNQVSLENDVVPLWLGTWHPQPDGQRELSTLVRAMSQRLGIRAIDSGSVLTSVTDPPSPVFLPDYHPDEFGSWLLAGLVYREIFSADLKVSESSMMACRNDWRNSDLQADTPASDQVARQVTCDELGPALLADIVRTLANPRQR